MNSRRLDELVGCSGIAGIILGVIVFVTMILLVAPVPFYVILVLLLLGCPGLTISAIVAPIGRELSISEKREDHPSYLFLYIASSVLFMSIMISCCILMGWHWAIGILITIGWLLVTRLGLGIVKFTGRRKKMTGAMNDVDWKDITKVKTYPISERENKISIGDFAKATGPLWEKWRLNSGIGRDFQDLCIAIQKAREEKKPIEDIPDSPTNQLAIPSGLESMQEHLNAIHERKEITSKQMVNLAKELYTIALYDPKQATWLENCSMSVKLEIKATNDVHPQGLEVSFWLREPIDNAKTYWADFMNRVNDKVKEHRRSKKQPQKSGSYFVSDSWTVEATTMSSALAGLIVPARILAKERLSELHTETVADIEFLKSQGEMEA